MKAIFKPSLLAALMLMSAACSQSRRSRSAAESNDKLYSPMSLCSNDAEAVSTTDLDTRAITGEDCFEFQPNITQNTMFLDVKSLEFDPGVTPYRVLAKYKGESKFKVMADNLSVAEGGTVTIKIKEAGKWVEGYVEWKVELTKFYYIYDDSGNILQGNGTYLLDQPLGKGFTIAFGTFAWPEITSR